MRTITFHLSISMSEHTSKGRVEHAQHILVMFGYVCLVCCKQSVAAENTKQYCGAHHCILFP